MSLATKSQNQAAAIGELAALLHVRRQGVASLISRIDNPLPLPANEDGGHFILDNHYKLKLLCWVQKEKLKKRAGKFAALDFTRIEHELESITQPKHWSIEEELNRRIPEKYLG